MWLDDKNLNKVDCLRELMKLRFLAEETDSKFNVNNYVYVVSAEVYDEIVSEVEFSSTGWKLFGIKIIIDYYDIKDYKLFKEVD